MSPRDFHLNGIEGRWKINDYTRWHWRLPPAVVEILIYADGTIAFNGGSFDGLQHVIQTLRTDPWYWVQFKLTLAHRESTPAQSGGDLGPANGQTLRLGGPDLPLDKYDEVWLFGIAPYEGGGLTNSLSAAEIAALEAFMDNGGGVLTTGDHDVLGYGLSGAVKRVGKLRQYPAPSSAFSEWNNTLRDGNNDGSFDFAEQSDSTPQNIRLKTYPLWSSYPIFQRRSKPHPLLCGPNGPIDVLPDHEHEGQIVIPANFPVNEWPVGATGYQPVPEAIAWGRILTPLAVNNQNVKQHIYEFPVIGVYDGHAANVGRIVADSTWHHWFDINLVGLAANVTALHQIEAYYLNVALWLAPRFKQNEMRNASVWGVIWRDPLVMINLHAYPIHILGGVAENAIGQYAPQCTILSWVWFPIPPLLLERYRIIIDLPDPPPWPLENFVLGVAIRQLVEKYVTKENVFAKAPSHEDMNAIFEQSVPLALSAAEQQFTNHLKEIKTLIREGDKPSKDDRTRKSK